MPSPEPNPFASPKSPSMGRESAKLAAMPPTVDLSEQNWPQRATQSAEIEELSRPWGRPVSVARRWGNGRWLVAILVLFTLSYFVFIVLASTFSFLDTTSSSPNFWALVVTSILTIGLGIPYTLFHFRQDAIDEKKLRRLIRRRKEQIEPLPVSDNPVLIVIVPRNRWQFSHNEMTAYVAFSHINLEEKLITLDGDQFRFRIPVNSLLDVSVEQLQKYPTSYWFVRLVIQTQAGPQELCFRLGNSTSLWQSNSQRESEAKEYGERILLLKNST